MRKITKGRLGDIKFQLNPTNINYDAGGTWATISSPGLDKPITSYSYGNPGIISFELWIYERHEIPVNATEVYKKLDEYRKSKEPIIFAFGSFVTRVVITSCPITLESWNPQLQLKELRVQITLQEVYY